MVWPILCFFFSFKGFLLLLYMLFEVHYFLHIVFYLILLRFVKDRLPLLVTYTSYGVCTTNDLDLLFHMNNSRYLRAMDFNRIWFWARSGLYKEARKLNGTVVQSGCSIRYRKPITLFQAYKIDLKVLYWDDRSMYAEQSFITLHDGFVRAIALTKQTCVGPSMLDIIEKTTGERLTSPLPTPELVKWMEANELSSQKLRVSDRDVSSVQPFRGADRIFGKVNSNPCACLQEAACTCPDKLSKLE